MRLRLTIYNEMRRMITERKRTVVYKNIAH